MKKQILLFTALTAASFTFGAVVVSEPFDYGSGTDLDSSTTGGSGWSGGWYSDTGLSNSPTVFGVTDYTWNLPALPSGSYQMLDKKSVDTTGSGSAYAGRGLSTGIDFDSDGTYYLSYTMDTVSGIGQELDLFAGSSEILSVQYLGGGNTLRMTTTNSSNSGTKGATAGNDWFVVVKLETSAAGDDIARLSVFEAGDTVPATESGWDVSHNGGTITGTVDQIAQWKYFNTGVGIGNLRVADSYIDAVSAVPEPSAYAFVLGAGMLGLVLYRRRRR